jgi:hypothetical protein
MHSASRLPLHLFILAEWRLCSKRSKEAIVLLFPLFFCRHRTHFLSIGFTSHCCSFTFSLSNAFGFSALSPCSFSLSLSPPTVALSLSRFQIYSTCQHSFLALSLYRIHLPLLLFHFLGFKCIRLHCTLSLLLLLFHFLSFTSD